MALIGKAERRWLRLKELDRLISDAGREAVAARPDRGWVASIRAAIGMTQAQLAARLGVTGASVNKLEQREVDGGATLGALRRAADALGCELQYRLVPRGGSLERLVRDRTAEVAERLSKSWDAETSGALNEVGRGAPELIAQRLYADLPRTLWSEDSGRASPTPFARESIADEPTKLAGGKGSPLRGTRDTPKARRRSTHSTSEARTPALIEQLDVFGLG